MIDKIKETKEKLDKAYKLFIEHDSVCPIESDCIKCNQLNQDLYNLNGTFMEYLTTYYDG